MPLLQLDDTQLHYRTLGRGAPCIALHGGLGLDHTYLSPAMDPLGESLQLTYLDLRGHGGSSRVPVEQLTLERFTQDVEALRAHLGHERVGILGHSVGGMIALQYALRHPDRVAFLILVDTASAMDDWEQVASNVRARGTPEAIEAFMNPRVRTDADLQRWLADVAPLYFKHYDPKLASRLFARILYNAEAWNATASLFDGYDVTDQLGRIRAPTLILVGREDFICPVLQSERLRKGIPDSELVVFEESGHLPYAEEPEAFTRAVRAWLSRPWG